MTKKETKQISVAFVCLGNICRSPMAEAIFTHKVKTLGLSKFFNKIDSFGTSSYHVGDDPDFRSSQTCKKHGVPVNHHAKHFEPKFFNEFDYVICMDESNLYNLNERIRSKTSTKNEARLFGDWNTDGKFKTIVDDPYYGGIDGFEYNFQQCSYFSEEFLKQELDVEL
ncbi:Low molecular weight phosphotyrosine protein phosphatase [Wickerhamomyces ciferrii]|uniref:Low molecular weight phosphotyrosine protein phosphatase n=1 Tax=Wickerhamomyces ciferrii (strain ATCC 14091 / BCRC 22168 / CBS 111 / JCM 3599 / NBRC 0793 / NRRL Y-1031 F-60-10) TaxID=1206466 RepID=K0KRW0_WICCF|nr:Low molecular weight phosphotyrosine protein phosphatase [Wickerhamomyces ciferrii]CCH45871.1 Low molecular weight phosphotyrosine protein phosphatase [Wickerhamomyces ciferrii]